MIGWARSFTKDKRILAAILSFIAPWAVAIVGYPIDGFKVHGAFAFVMLSVPVATILAIILAAMAIHAGGISKFEK
jgi:hypothetical protein